MTRPGGGRTGVRTHQIPGADEVWLREGLERRGCMVLDGPLDDDIENQITGDPQKIMENA